MFELEKALARWRGRQERESSLSARELDELEDHLRARVDLELELNPGLTRARAFAAAHEELGDSRVLSSEFARAGRASWRGLLIVGWLLFGASFMMPTFENPAFFAPPPPTGATAPAAPIAADEIMTGWEALTAAISGIVGPLGVLSALSNVLMLVAGYGLLVRRTGRARWTIGLMAGTTVGNLLLWMPGTGDNLHAGYYAWVASFACVAVALWIRDREWSSARVEEVAA